MRVLTLEERAARHAALGEPVRLLMVDELMRSDRASVELLALTGLPSNLLAHHLDVLERVGLITRTRSSGDGRRRYIHLRREALGGLVTGRRLRAQSALFICSRNSARSQLAAALWQHVTDQPAESGGTDPAARVHPGAVAAARRADLDISDAAPRHLSDVAGRAALVVTVCDRAHEELSPPADWLHWSVPDPVPVGTRAAFDATVRELRDRITGLVDGPAT